MFRHVLVITAALLAGPALAGGNYAKVKGWSIDYSDSGQPQCLMSGTFETGTFLSLSLIGAGRDMEQMLLMAHKDWRSIREGQDIEVVLRFDDKTPWTVTADGVEMDAGGGGFIAADPAYSDEAGRFATDFKYASVMTLAINGRDWDHFNLKGSAAAYEKMVECQGRLLAASAPNDPFAASTDPFATGNDQFAR